MKFKTLHPYLFAVLLVSLSLTARAVSTESGAPLEGITHFVTPQSYPKDDDGDGWPTWREDRKGTDPLVADTDGDGIADPVDPAPLTAADIDVKALPDATLRSTANGPQLCVNGKFIPFMWFENMSFERDAVVEQRMRRAGIRVFTFWHYMLDRAHQAQSFDVLDARIEQIIANVPDAYIIVRFVPAHSEEFAKRYPGEVLTAADGISRFDDKVYGAHYYATFASDVWKWKVGQDLTDHINHMMRAGYRDRVIGINILNGNSGEWWWWSSLSGGRNAFDIDYSPAMQRAFDQYLRMRYCNSLDALRLAWGDPCAVFDAPLPTPAERRAVGTEFFDRLYLPNNNPRVFDFNLAFNAVMPSHAEYFAKVIKRATGGRYVVGVETHHNMHAVFNNGSTLNWPLMDCPQIDYFSSPNDYDRKPGDCTNVRVPWASLKLHDKVFANESDVRVHNLSASTPEEAAEVWGLKSNDDTLEVLKRDFATLACQGLVGYWMQWEQFWYDNPQIAELFSRQSSLSRFLASIDRSARNQVAVVADAESQIVARYDVNPMLARQWDLCRMGAPYDFYELSDILRPGVADAYRVIIFLNIPALTQQERQQIESLKSGGRTLIWMFCPGVLDRSAGWKASADAVGTLTGIRVRFQDVPMRAPVQLDNAMFQQWTGRSAPSETIYPAERHYFTAPIVADDQQATVLGRFDGKEPAMVGRRFDQWTSILCPTTTMSPAIWRDLLRSAGVHLYIDTDDVIAGNGGPLLMIHTSQGGTRKVDLPRKTDVIDLYSGQAVGRQTRGFELDADRGRTYFYYLGPADEALQRLGEAIRTTAEDEAKAASMMPATQPSPSISSGPVPLNNHGYVTRFLVAGPFDNLKQYG
jgi:beta-galactosidase